MARRGKLDSAGGAWRSPLKLRLRFAFVLVFVGCGSLPGFSQIDPSNLDASAKKYFEQERWAEVAALADFTAFAQANHFSGDFTFYYASALARLGRWTDAEHLFRQGEHSFRKDERFAVELAGVEFKQKNYGEAKRGLRRALRLKPGDAYALDFLATLYFLEGNAEAALKYWNRVKKPRVQEVSADPAPKVNSVLLDRALGFSPASVLLRPDLLTSQARVQGLGIFSSERFDLQARSDGSYDVIFRNSEKDGCGGSGLRCALATFRSLPAQTVTPEYFNFRSRAINLRSLYRWDAEKRRVRAEVEGPIWQSAKERFRLGTDWREENWNIVRSFTGPAPLLGGFNLRREAVTAEYLRIVSGSWQWAVGAEGSHRDFRSVVAGPAVSSSLLAKGYQLKEEARVDGDVLRLPERRLVLNAGATAEAGHIWSDPAHNFEKLQGRAAWHWFPKAVGDDYEVQHTLRAGKSFGELPFDELHTLGVYGDNDLWMRGHITTRDGRKGSGPLGRDYFLSNFEADKNVYQRNGFTVKVGPLVDTGEIWDSTAGLGSRKWLVDVGLQVKVRAFGVGVGVAYGKDLRSGNNALTVGVR